MTLIANLADFLFALGKTGSLTDEELGLLNNIHPRAEQVVKDFLQNDVVYATRTELLPIGNPSRYSDDVLLRDYDKVGGRVIASSRYYGAKTLQLKHTPVRLAGLQVYEDIGANAGQNTSPFAAGTLLVGGKDYWLDATESDPEGNLWSRTGVLHRVGSWPQEPRCVKVVYAGGWTVDQLAAGPAMAIREAVVLTVVKMFRQYRAIASNPPGTTGKTAENIGKYSVSYGSDGGASTGMVLTLPMEARELLQPFRNYGRLF